MHMHHTYLCIKCNTHVSSVHTYTWIKCTHIHMNQVYTHTHTHVSSVHSPKHMHLYGIQPTLTYVFTLAIVESNIWISLSTETRVVNNFSVTTTTTTKSVRNFFRSGRVLRRFRFYHRRRLASFSSTSSSKHFVSRKRKRERKIVFLIFQRRWRDLEIHFGRFARN